MSTDVLWPAATKAAWPGAAETAELEEEVAVADNAEMGEIDTGAAEEADADEIEQDDMMQGQMTPKHVHDTTPEKEKWKPVQVCDEIIGIRGGFLPARKAVSAKSILIMTQTQDTKGKKKYVQTPIRFVELDKNAEWLLKAAGGAKVQKGEMKAVCVIDDIRLNIDTAIKAETAVAEDKDSQGQEDAQEDAADYDPMDELADFYQKTNAPKPKKGSKPKAKPRAKKADNRSRIMTLEMPKRPIWAGGGEDKITISVYLKNASKYVCPAKRSIWLNSSCIGWLIAYAADEKYYEGGMRDTVQTVKEQNCAIDNLHVEYQIDKHSWTGEFLDGALCGTNRELFISSITKKRWEKMIQCQIQIHKDQPLGDFDAAGEVTKKQVAKKLLMVWMSALRDNQGPEFEQVWQLEQASEKTAPQGKAARKRRKKKSD